MSWTRCGRTLIGERAPRSELCYGADLRRAMGQLFFMGWEGTEVTPQIRTLIEDHHLGSILLTTKNLKSIWSFLCSAS